MLRLYDNATSRNGYKVRLLLAHLGTPYERALSVTESRGAAAPAPGSDSR